MLNRIKFQGNCPKCLTYFSNLKKCDCRRSGGAGKFNLPEHFQTSLTETLKTLPSGYKIKTEGKLLPDNLIWFGLASTWLTASSFLPTADNVPVEIFALVAEKENKQDDTK